eukprot:s278_g30.t1
MICASFVQVDKVEGSFNKFKLKPGQWTDDTSMALCLADSLLVCEGYDGADIRVRFWNWWHRGYNNAFRRDKGRHASVGLGGNVAQSLKDVQNNSPSPRFESTSQDAGNGSLMRLAPVPIFFSSTCEKAAALSEESSRTTHPGKVAAAACHFLGFFLAKAISRGTEPCQSAAQFLSQVVEDYLAWPWSPESYHELTLPTPLSCKQKLRSGLSNVASFPRAPPPPVAYPPAPGSPQRSTPPALSHAPAITPAMTPLAPAPMTYQGSLQGYQGSL